MMNRPQQQPPQHRPVPQQQYIPNPNYRNDVYDVPRSTRNNNVNNFYVNVPNINQRRSNLHLDLNRPRGPPISQQRYQRSFDDTESVYGYQAAYNVYDRYNNRDSEPLYQNSAYYGRFDVIGTGIGRFERHLSSSCGSIDNCNVGGHYAILAGPMAPMNANGVNNQTVVHPSAQNPRQESVKSFFSCLGGESSQSLISVGNSVQAQQAPANQSGGNVTGIRPTGAIPKIKTKQSNKVSPKPTQADVMSGNNVQQAAAPPVEMSQSNRISKSSLQYLLMNKFLPVGPDYKIIDFNFMFSRPQNGQYENPDSSVQLVDFNGQAEMVEPGLSAYQPQREYPTMNPTNYPRVIRNTPQLSRLRESESEMMPPPLPQSAESAAAAQQFRGVNNGNAFRARSESPSLNNANAAGVRPRNAQEDPFRSWSFNFENNSFRPAGAVAVKDVVQDAACMQQQQQRKSELPAIVVEQQQELQAQEIQPPQPVPSPKSTTPDSTTSSSSTSSSSQISRPSEMKKSENYENLASLQAPASVAAGNSQNENSVKGRKKKSTESQSSDSVTLADDEDDAFEELDTDID